MTTLHSIVLHFIVDKAQAQCGGSRGGVTTTMVKDDGDSPVMSEGDEGVKGGDEGQTETGVRESSYGDNGGGVKGVAFV